MKKWTVILSIISTFVLLVAIGCQKVESTKEKVYENFQKKIITMKSYSCVAEVEVVGNKAPGKYIFIHSYEKPDNYKLEVVEPSHLKGKTIEYKQDKIFISNPDIDDKIELPNIGDNNQYLFIGDFIENYIQNEDVKIKLDGDYLTLETSIPGENEYFNKQILYVNKTTKEPEKMQILDKDGKVRFTVEYKEFEYKK